MPSLSVEGLPPREANHQLRIQLAAAHVGLAKLGLVDRVFNHLSVWSPAANGQGEVLLISPFPMDFAEVTPRSLLGINEQGDVVEGVGALNDINGSFHRGFYFGDPSKRCMMHTHSPFINSLACLEDPTFKMIHQTAARLYGRIAYDMDYGGIVNDIKEGQRFGELMASGPYEGILLAHHGAIASGSTVAKTFNLMVQMEQCAMYQIRAMQTGQRIVEMEQQILEETSKELCRLENTLIGEAHLSTIIAKLAQNNPEFI